MADWKGFSRAHNLLFKCSGGRLGAKLAGLDMAIIDTIGRKSGQIRPAPAVCYPYKDNVVVVASNNGGEKDPVWWLNLKSKPQVNVHLGKQTLEIIAIELHDEDRENIWADIININP
ncbi:MAG: nitroreductase family deazaflavin-dependent oxidoreductase [Pseudomonadales bacterium]|nr:nitroreductase family deazaflavin-dependent oxidoreductase [Pseudomonadales bacterium]